MCGVRQCSVASALDPSDIYRCFVLVAPEDPDVEGGRYEASLKGTAWADRIVYGLQGAEKQVFFAEMVVPLGCHVVIVDDDVIELREVVQGTDGNNALQAIGEFELSKLIRSAWFQMDACSLNVCALITSHQHKTSVFAQQLSPNAKC